MKEVILRIHYTPRNECITSAYVFKDESALNIRVEELKTNPNVCCVEVFERSTIHSRFSAWESRHEGVRPPQASQEVQ